MLPVIGNKLWTKFLIRLTVRIRKVGWADI